MYKLVTNDSSAYALSIPPFEGLLEKKGVQKKVLCLAFGEEIDTLAKVKEICADELKMAVLTVYEDSVEVRVETDYTVLEQITTATVTDAEGKEVDVLMAKMSKSTTIPAQIAMLEDKVDALQKENTALKAANDQFRESLVVLEKLEKTTTGNTEDINTIQKQLAGVNENELDLEGLKKYRIAQSKINLANYLETHKVKSDVHGGVVAEYSITQEKQTQLMAVIMMATLNSEYQPSWNASGEVCTYDWTLDELQVLAATIEATVRPLVSAQQQMEVDIMAAESIEAVKAVNINF